MNQYKPTLCLPYEFQGRNLFHPSEWRITRAIRRFLGYRLYVYHDLRKRNHNICRFWAKGLAEADRKFTARTGIDTRTTYVGSAMYY